MDRMTKADDDDASRLWKTIDKIAEERDMSLPRLALGAGLDQSTFSHARRKRNWMSLRTLTRVLRTYDITFREWARIVEPHEK